MSSRSHLWRLDAVRGFAAFYVFLSHARPLGPVALYQYGQEAVILFFLLSGFVIDYSTFSGGRALVVRTYLIHRVRRIYPLLLVSLLLGYLSACVAAQGWAPPRLFSLVMNLLMFQDVAHLKRGVFANTYYGVTPLWSLAYEWWFYLLFIPMCLRLRTGDAARTVVAGTISAIAFVLYQAWPNQPCLYLSYFIIWWCGVSLAREYR
ncbi:MAG TPA: acyltransferase family protein, partial [Nevskiaceae bacterium]|nr:acyltransferase family protein [Nevskiaceae bacterium]